MNAIPYTRDTDGNVMTVHDLPGPTPRGRWTPKRKHNVCLALEAKLLTEEQACKRYGLSADELQEWRSHYREQGRAGLTVMSPKGQAARTERRRNWGTP